MKDQASLFRSIQIMIAMRKKHAAFGSSGMEWIETDYSAVAVYIRKHKDDTLLILNNLSSSVETVRLPAQYQKTYVDLLAEQTNTFTENLMLEPYEYLWLQLLN